MTEPGPPRQLAAAVTSLNNAFRDLKELVEGKADDDESKEHLAKLTDDDRMQLTDFADEVDDVLRRVAALKSRLEPVI